jgi:hypothetical protein
MQHNNIMSFEELLILFPNSKKFEKLWRAENAKKELEQYKNILYSHPYYWFELETQMNVYLEHEKMEIEKFNMEEKIQEWKNRNCDFRDIGIYRRKFDKNLNKLFKSEQVFIFPALIYFPGMQKRYDELFGISPDEKLHVSVLMSDEEHQSFIEAFCVVNLYDRIVHDLLNGLGFRHNNICGQYLEIIERKAIPLLMNLGYKCRIFDIVENEKQFVFIIDIKTKEHFNL